MMQIYTFFLEKQINVPLIKISIIHKGNIIISYMILLYEVIRNKIKNQAIDKIISNEVEIIGFDYN